MGPTRKGQHGSLACCVAQESLEKKEEEDGEVEVEKDTQVVAEKELEEVDLGSDSQEPRPISISASLTEKEKSELILLLKEFKDVFAWDYSEMPGLDLGLVAYTLNIDPGAKPVAQPARIFHRNRGTDSQRGAKVAGRRIHQAYPTPSLAIQHSTSKEEERPDKMLCRFINLNKACPKDEFPLPNMDLLMGSAAGSAMFSFMDGFSGYN